MFAAGDLGGSLEEQVQWHECCWGGLLVQDVVCSRMDDGLLDIHSYGWVWTRKIVGVSMSIGGQHGAEAQMRLVALHMGLVHAVDQTLKFFFQL